MPNQRRMQKSLASAKRSQTQSAGHVDSQYVQYTERLVCKRRVSKGWRKVEATGNAHMLGVATSIIWQQNAGTVREMPSIPAGEIMNARHGIGSEVPMGR